MLAKDLVFVDQGYPKYIQKARLTTIKQYAQI